MRLYLAVAVNRPEVDLWTDPDIELSAPYTVVGDYMSIAVVTKGKLKIAPSPNVTSFSEFLLFLPEDVNPNSVVSLASVLQLGGSVFARGGISVIPQPAQK
jgi:hypothetical protein